MSCALKKYFVPSPAGNEQIIIRAVHNWISEETGRKRKEIFCFLYKSPKKFLNSTMKCYYFATMSARSKIGGHYNVET